MTTFAYQQVKKIHLISKNSDYKLWVNEHLLKSDNLDLRLKVRGLFKGATKLIEKVKIELSSQEETF